MYFKSIELENVGPVKHLNIEFDIRNETPKPIVLVGENGSGKSILLSYLANSLLVGKQEIFEDTEVNNGKVYKYRSPHYIRSGEDYFFGSVKFDSDIEVSECQLRTDKKSFEDTKKYLPARKILKELSADQSSIFFSSFPQVKNELDKFYKGECCLFFPVNRFEEPGWLNIESLKQKTQYSELKHVTGISNRQVICTAPLKANKNWILDILLDRQLYDIQIHPIASPVLQIGGSTSINVFSGFTGESSIILSAINQVLTTILREQGSIRLGASTRKNRQISIMKDEKEWVPNLFQLSTGEVLLLNLFLSIVRDFDLTNQQISSISDIKGIVLIDEIDAHLHTIYQKEVLPNLLALFPKVQFIMTSHSPLFLLGMEEKFGHDGFDIYELPSGEKITASDFSEFHSAYEAFRSTQKHRIELSTFLQSHSKPIIFVEGQTDIDYIKKAAENLDKVDLLSKLELHDGTGFGSLDKIWKNLDTPLAKAIRQNIVLLYDCDTMRGNKDNGRVFSRTIPQLPNNPIKKGIENLFSEETILRAEASSSAFIDKTESRTIRTRGISQIDPSVYSVNPNEKRNLCDWLIENGSENDFKEFEAIFKILDEFV